MRTAPLLLSLAVAATAQSTDGAAASGLRAARASTQKRGVAPARPSKDHKARAQRSQRRTLANSVHNTLFKKETKSTETDGGRRLESDRGAKTAAAPPAGDGDRELKKTKAFKSAKGYDRQVPLDDADGNDDRFAEDYMYGKSAKAYDDDIYHAAGKSGKSGNYSGKSGKAYMYDGDYYGKSGKGSGGRHCHNTAYVTVTNISYKQAFSEIFFMTAAEAITDVNPLYAFGARANNALATLAADADPTEMLRRYTDRAGVEQAKIHAAFGTANAQEKYLNGGDSVTLEVATTGHGDRLSLAAGLPFTNDGFVALEGAPIVDGAMYKLYPLDAGVEGNIQTCWSVPAMQADFPPQSACADEDESDQNNNNIPGENFVGMHRGMQLIDSNDDLDNLLLFPTCSDFDLDSSADSPGENFANYFYELGYNDESLLCGRRIALAGCTYADDADFLSFIQGSSEFDGTDDRAIEIALDSTDFSDFCSNIKKVNQEIEDLLKTLEPILFDWRNDVAHVEISCEMDDEEEVEPLESEGDDYWP